MRSFLLLWQRILSFVTAVIWKAHLAVWYWILTYGVWEMAIADQHLTFKSSRHMSCLLPSEVKVIPVSGNSNFSAHLSFPKFKCFWLVTWYVPASSSWESQSRAERRRRWKSVGLLSSVRLRKPEAEDERKREWRRWWSRALCEVKPEMSQEEKMLWWDDVFEIQNRNHSLIHSSYINTVLHTEQHILQPWNIASWYVSIISQALKSRLQ